MLVFVIWYIFTDWKYSVVDKRKGGLQVYKETEDLWVSQTCHKVEDVRKMSEHPESENFRLPTNSEYHEKENLIKLDEVRDEHRELFLIVEYDVNVFIYKLSAKNNCN